MLKASNQSEGLGSRLFRGSVWTIGMRLSLRLMGLVSMAIVARLLVPSDFGIFAITTAFMGFIVVFTYMGVDVALIRHPDPKDQHYNTVWTYKLLMCSGAAIIIAISAPLVAHIYNDGRYESVIRVMALATFIGGWANVGVVDFRRNMDFRKDFQLNVLVQLFGVVATVGLALLSPSYWALVLGTLARSVAGVGLSYAFHPRRPKFSFAAHAEMIGFSVWTTVRSVGLFLIERGDRLMVGAFFSPTVTGWYAIAGDLASMAVYELLQPIGRALLPALAIKLGDDQWERRNLKKLLNVTATLAMGMGFGMSALAAPLLTVLYGSQFTPAAKLLSILAVSMAIDGFGHPVSQILVVLGRMKELALLLVGQGGVKLGVYYILCSQGADILTLVYAGLGITLLVSVRIVYLTTITRNLNWRDMLTAWLRPAFAGITMFAFLWEWQLNVAQSPQATLAVCVPLGVTVFVGTLLLAWQVSGRPAGIEQEVFRRLARRSSRV